MNQQAEKGFQYVHPVHWFQCCSRFSNLQLDVIDTKETREFTVQVQSEVFRPAGLKLQEGPDPCFARLKQELQGETQEAPAEAHLGIGQQDVREYLEQHSGSAARQENRIRSLTLQPNDWCQRA